jgi:hypothetical protein
MTNIDNSAYLQPQQTVVKSRSRTPQPEEVAQYAADMTLELRNLAKAAGLKTLQGLLEVTYYEAFAAAHPAKVPDGELERLGELERAGRASEAAA